MLPSWENAVLVNIMGLLLLLCGGWLGQPHSSSVCVVLGREGGAQTAVDQQDDDGDGLLRRRKRSSGWCVFHRLIGRHADGNGRLVLMGCNRKSVSRHSLSSNLFVYRLVFLTFFVGTLPVLPVVVLLSLCHEGSGRHYDMCVRIPQRLTPKEGGVVSRETPPHVGLGLHAVQVHDWQKKRNTQWELQGKTEIHQFRNIEYFRLVPTILNIPQLQRVPLNNSITALPQK